MNLKNLVVGIAISGAVLLGGLGGLSAEASTEIQIIQYRVNEIKYQTNGDPYFFAESLIPGNYNSHLEFSNGILNIPTFMGDEIREQVEVDVESGEMLGCTLVNIDAVRRLREAEKAQNRHRISEYAQEPTE